MKRVSKALGILFLCAFIGASSPGYAQTTDATTSTTTTETTDDGDDDTGKWGLAGLLGLLGLLGLRKKDDDHRHTSTNVNR